MEWLNSAAGSAVVSAVVGALAGALVTFFGARAIARASERGRVQEDARQKLLATVRVYRARVAMERGNQPRSGLEPLSLESAQRQRFAEDVETHLVHGTPKTRRLVREHLEKLTGPLVARTAAWAAPLSLDERNNESRVVNFLDRAAKEGLNDQQLADHGLLGTAYDKRASETGASTPALDAALQELQRLERTIERRH